MLHEEYGEIPEDIFKELIEHEAKLDEIFEWFLKLNLMEQRVLILRHSFSSEQIRRYEEIAEKYNVSKERIRQCALNALWKLRHRGIRRNRE